MARPRKCHTETRKVRSVRLTDSQWAKLQAMGSSWLGVLLDSQAAVPAIEPTQIPEKAASQPAPSDRASVLAAFVRDHLRIDPDARTHKSDVRLAWIRYPAADELDRKGADDLTEELPRMLAGVTLDGGYYNGLALVDNSACA